MGSSCNSCQMQAPTDALHSCQDMLQGSHKVKALAEPTGMVHDGQVRASLHVKEGGFALGNFATINPGKLEDFYELQKLMGEGSFGTVQQVRDKRTGLCHASKKFAKSAADKREEKCEEVIIMKLLDHPNIVRLTEYFEDPRFIYLVMDLCEGGELFDLICETGHFTEVAAARCVTQMLLAVNYLHQNRIMHRDLKPENFLLVSKQPVESCTLKLIDFGTATRFDPDVSQREIMGTLMYLAPEVLSKRYNEKADLWSLGVIVYIMLCGQEPYTAINDADMKTQIRAGNLSTMGKDWFWISREAKDLVGLLLTKDVASRPMALQVLQLPWLSRESSDAGLQASLPKLDVQQLKSFGKMNQMKKAALTVIATQLSEPMIEGLRQMFLDMDINKDGSLSAAELKAGLEKTDVNVPANLQDMMAACDTDGSGAIDYTEFIAATIDKKLLHQENVMWAAFKKFDQDGSGFIDRRELAAVLQDREVTDAMHLSGDNSAIDQILADADADGDGRIDFEEFFQMMRAASDPDSPKYTKSKKNSKDKDSKSSVGAGKNT